MAIPTGSNRGYIERWTAELGLVNLWQEIA
jgi:hypothetical protein